MLFTDTFMTSCVHPWISKWDHLKKINLLPDEQILLLQSFPSLAGINENDTAAYPVIEHI